ncbi:hypothetical protein [Mycobacterium sp. D16R24]|uniref:hypothetical protein n=1 Tax=Mycobacterium sp. D16R24 TaxID=1855656 RepID=UPI0009935B62|nr:hypothetical protein [Mycobacterium sp. D16R24]
MTRSHQQYESVRHLIDAGLNDCAISRQTGVPRRTVCQWRHTPQQVPRSDECTSHDFSALFARPYAYLLGMYLGDGYISRSPRTWRLRVTCDTKYPDIITKCRKAIDALMPGQRASIVDRIGNCVDVSLSSKHWPCLFPQHGPGRKHSRKIALEPWQQDLVDQATEDFLRGLIHSDGCRVVASIRYHFTNRSEDILGLFTAALDSLDIPWTRSTKYIVSIYRKAATARLDEFIGPKR